MKKSTIMALCIIIPVIMIIVCIGIYLYSNYIFPKGKNYDSKIYSVVIYNNTNSTQDNITVSYGGAEYNEDTAYTVEVVRNIQPKEYRKVNILTENPNPQAELPYNVWVKSGNKQGICVSVGYFGKNSGGFALVEIAMDGGDMCLRPYTSSDNIYKKVYRRYRKKQNELSWY